jgi:uncharacterized protein YndB with AHSA1/START domain
MAPESGKKRIDSASKVIRASPHIIYQAYMDPEALVAWLPPKGMKGRIDVFDPREGGMYRMALTYEHPGHSAPGKSSEHSDIVHGRFLELIADTRIVQQVEFESGDPAFAGAMKMTWTLSVVPGGTEVAVLCEDVPEGIRPEEHAAGLQSTLENLAAFTERAAG